ncbi:MAG: SgcJ/EcaC family oxidoreductase [Bryobacterales bacterium]|nr:SgcJ/EcaC family oxidoreductase [Bryobacterales bacterium]
MWTLLLLSLRLMAAEPEETIRRLLTEQSEAWNRGDIPAFMKTYENSAETAYVGSGGVTKGYQQVLERYRKKYAGKAQMGTLRFTDLQVRALTADVATVTGRFQLTRTKEAGGDASGWFTLVLRKTRVGWQIVHDHTS